MVPPDNPWFVACAPSGAIQDYPYGGNSYVTGKCNGAEACPCAFVDVAATETCISANGAKNQSGNVAEMSNDCNQSQGMSDLCNVYGGDVGSTPPELACGSPFTQTRATTSGVVGFRCCVQ